jgi:serine/threonine protein phosphatase PrpC
MTNINTFFENAKLSDRIKVNQTNNNDQNDIVVFDDIDEFSDSFVNLSNIKNINKQNIMVSSEKNIEERAKRGEKNENFNTNKIENFNENKAEKTKHIPVIQSEFINTKDVSTNIDSIFSNFKNTSLFNGNFNLQGNTYTKSDKEKESKIESYNSNIDKMNNYNNINNSKNTSHNTNSINKNRDENNCEVISFERNSTLRNKTNSTKDMINLLSKPSTDKFNCENMKNFNTNNIQNNNSRYNHLNRKTNNPSPKVYNNNSSINMNDKVLDINKHNGNLNKKPIDSQEESSNFKLNNYNKINNRYNFKNNNMETENEQVNYKSVNTSQKQEFFSVKEYAGNVEMNPKFKNTMEDFIKIIDQYNTSNMGFFSLYDGHGGDDPVKFVKEHMPEILKKLINDNQFTIEECLKKAFLQMDEKLVCCDSENAGLTATVILKDGNSLYVANVGDSKCILISKNKELRDLSYDHKCTDEKEVERIRAAGGLVFNHRVFGQLVLTRALGDLSLKPYGVLAEPYVVKIDITTNDDYVIVASDGIWDVIFEEHIKQILNTTGKCEEICNMLISESINKGSKDNISCIVIKL